MKKNQNWCEQDLVSGWVGEWVGVRMGGRPIPTALLLPGRCEIPDDAAYPPIHFACAERSVTSRRNGLFSLLVSLFLY